MAGSSTDVLAKRPRTEMNVRTTLLSQSKQTKTALMQTLVSLKTQGLLEVDVTRGDLKRAAEHHANQDTPYGKVVQKVEINAPRLKYLDIVHPLAFLFYLTTISVAFAELMYSCVHGNPLPLALVIYADEMTPGNPFRPEKTRTLQCVYWAFADWPAHVLCRTFAWPVLCLIRTPIVDSLEGGMSYICRMILRVFFPLEGHSLMRGIYLAYAGTRYVMTAIFAGFLCDLKGHKENTEWVGYNGNHCCLSCGNVDKRIRGTHTPGVVGLDCPDPAQFIRHSNEDVYNTIDELTALITGTPSKIDKFQTELGFNFCPNGLLFDPELRDLYKPVDHTLRDWQHTMAGDGVANSVLGEVLSELKRLKYPMDTVRDFLSQCTLPSKYGTARAEWLKDSRIKLHTLTSFSGIVLTLVPILYLYMSEFCKDDARLSNHFACVEILHYILGVMATGTDKPWLYLDKLKEWLPKLHAEFIKITQHLKPKLHHMHHIIDHMEWFASLSHEGRGKLLSCFVTERKHRQIKDAALHIFRYMEHTVLVDVVNQMCQQLIDGHDLFAKMFLVSGRPLKAQPEVLSSSSAVLECGLIKKGDILFFEDHTCGQVLAFFVISGIYFVEIRDLPALHGNAELRDATSTTTMFKECRHVVDACIWYAAETEGVVRVCVPPILLFAPS